MPVPPRGRRRCCATRATVPSQVAGGVRGEDCGKGVKFKKQPSPGPPRAGAAWTKCHCLWNLATGQHGGGGLGEKRLLLRGSGKVLQPRGQHPGGQAGGTRPERGE